jgi:hypothetical protein
MMINCDKFFVEELQKEGFEHDFKRIKEIYRQSRENPAYIRRRARTMRDNELIFEGLFEAVRKD